MATGTATINFGANPGANEASVTVSGLSGLTAGTHKEAFVQGDDSTGDNNADAHKILGALVRLACEYVSATEMKITAKLDGAFYATGQFTLHWATA